MSLLSFGALYATTYYVSPDGFDSNSGSENAPFRTIQKAADIVMPGDCVIVKAGTYYERIKIRTSGTETSPIIFQGEKKNNDEWLTIIDGSEPINGEWFCASEIGNGVYKSSAIPYSPKGMFINNKVVARIGDKWMQTEDGFEWLKKPATSTFQTTYLQEIINWWDGIELLYGYLGGSTYVRFKNNDNPNEFDIRATPKGAGILIDNKENIIISGFKIQGAQNAIEIKGSFARNNTIENNFLMHGINRILIADGANNNFIKRNQIYLNYYGWDDFGAWSNGKGVNYGIKEYVYAEIFKLRISEIGGSEDHGIYLYNSGGGNHLFENHIYQGLIGIFVWGPTNNTQLEGLKVYNNEIHNMSSIGIIEQECYLVNAQFYDNLIYDCNINLRIQRYNDQGYSGKSVYFYRNKFYNPIGIGDHIVFYWSSSILAPNFVHPIYYFYHNSFSGGYIGIDLPTPGKDIGLPNTHFINNIFSSGRFFRGLQPGWEEADRIGLFDYNWVISKSPYSSFPQWYGSNNIDGKGIKIWDDSNLPDFELPQSSLAKNSGIDLSNNFTINSTTYSSLPGMENNYFDGMRPDLGAINKPLDIDISPPSKPRDLRATLIK